jgi:hypothetical protein
MGGMPWFRLYSKLIDNDKLRLLAFEDRWHFVAILCLKSMGNLDEPEGDLKYRKIALKMGLQVRELEEVTRRLHEVKLIKKNMQPIGWDDFQFKSDRSKERVKAYRERKKSKGNVDVTLQKRFSDKNVTPQDTDTDTDTDKKLNKKNFIKPSIEEIKDYCLERKNGIDPVKFFNHYEAVDWMRGKNKIKSWKACVITWEGNNKTPQVIEAWD